MRHQSAILSPLLRPKATTILLLVDGTPTEAENMAKTYLVDAVFVKRMELTKRTVMSAPLCQYEQIVQWWKSGHLVRTLMEDE